MLGKTQKEMGEQLAISKQSYYLKEKGKVAFSDSEKVLFKNLLIVFFPDITVDSIFF